MVFVITLILMSGCVKAEQENTQLQEEINNETAAAIEEPDGQAVEEETEEASPQAYGDQEINISEECKHQFLPPDCSWIPDLEFRDLCERCKALEQSATEKETLN